jgi:hypothetical protein
MKKPLTASAAVLILAASAGSAQAVNCHSWACVNRQLKTDATTISRDAVIINQDTRALAVLSRCLTEQPLTRYGDSSAGTFGYQYNDGTGPIFNTAALDVTISGTKVGGWAMFDGCNTATSPAADVQARALRREFGPIAPMAPLLAGNVNRHR